MRKTYLTATIIAVVLVVWLYSGDHSNQVIEGSIAEQNRASSRVQSDAPPTRVRVAVLQASEQPRLIKVRGKTENKRTVTVRAELNGTIIERPVDRGARVDAGDLLCKVSTEDRFVALKEARASLQQARIEYQGAVSLKEKGFNSDAAIAAAAAKLAVAQSNLDRKELDLTKLDVRAPFAGFVEQVHQEIGDYVSPGAECATIIDLDPMLLTGRVSERDVTHLEVGQPATGILSDGREVQGPVTFIGQQSDPRTRTYAIEVELDNSDSSLRSGITSDIRIPVEYLLAQRVSPALFSLDDAGAIGIRTIDQDNVVQFHHVEVLSDAADGVWVTGLPNRATVIVVGQELVTAGERVDPVFVGQEMPANVDKTDPQPKTPSPAEQLTDPVQSGVASPVALNTSAS